MSTLQPSLPASTAPTFFAPAGRDAPEDFCRKRKTLQERPLLCQVLEALPTMLLVLNANRQIVAANQAFLNTLKANIDQIAEKRPGEALGCIRAKDAPDGCGTAVECVTCGAVQAILESQSQDRRVVRECRILAETPQGFDAMDLRVTATPLRVGDDRFVLAAVEDISSAKRLDVLQRTFFHDALNTAGCTEGYAQCLAGDSSGEPDLGARQAGLARELIEIIQGQRDLLQAESGDLEVQPEPMRVSSVLEELRSRFATHSAAEGRTIATSIAWDGAIVADRQLLLRVLSNMLKNALEATSPGGVVTLRCFEQGDEAIFAVHNAGVMPAEVQFQLFQRSFTTKGQRGRGIGTYSIKLFGERYLGGRVAFTSRAPEGTTFTLAIPKTPPTASRQPG